MSHPLVVHCKREPFDVYVGRKHKDFPLGSKWGNPFWLKDESERARILNQYRLWLNEQDHLLLQIIPELKGKRLGCWCAPKDCHADVLAELANDDSFIIP